MPLFLTADHGSFVKELNIELPPQMALGATDSEELAYKAGVFKAGGRIILKLYPMLVEILKKEENTNFFMSKGG